MPGNKEPDLNDWEQAWDKASTAIEAFEKSANAREEGPSRAIDEALVDPALLSA